MRLNQDGVYVVTGGAGGIGLAVCRALVDAGCRVALLDLHQEAVDKAVADIQGGDVRGFAVDVRSPHDVHCVIDQIAAEMGPPVGLVNLAGGGPRDLPLDLADITPELIHLIIDSNLKGAIFVSQAVFKHMREAGGGAIVHTSSLAGRAPSALTDVSYQAAKAGVLGLVRRLAREGAPSGIRVNSIAPGAFFTPAMSAVFESRSPEVKAEINASIPMGRGGELREIVEPILFLLSEHASYITGATLDVNGGRFMP